MNNIYIYICQISVIGKPFFCISMLSRSLLFQKQHRVVCSDTTQFTEVLLWILAQDTFIRQRLRPICVAPPKMKRCECMLHSSATTGTEVIFCIQCKRQKAVFLNIFSLFSLCLIDGKSGAENCFAQSHTLAVIEPVDSSGLRRKCAIQSHSLSNNNAVKIVIHVLPMIYLVLHICFHHSCGSQDFQEEMRVCSEPCSSRARCATGLRTWCLWFLLSLLFPLLD